MRSTLLIAALVAGAALARPAFAGPGDVIVGGDVLFTIKAPASGQSATRRAEIVVGRLVRVLGDLPDPANSVSVWPQRDGSVLLKIKDQLLVTVTNEDGRINDRSARQQADYWAMQLRKTLPDVAAEYLPDPIVP